MKSCLILLMCMTPLVMSGSPLTLVDLSRDLGQDDIPAFFEGPRYKLKPFFADVIESGIYIEQNYFVASENSGTHIEAPSFTSEGGYSQGPTIDQIPLESTVAYGVVIDCSYEASQQRGYEAPVQKVLDWEKKNGRIPDGAAVIFNFGWARFYDNQMRYRGTYDLSDMGTYVFPSVAPETGRFLLEKRDISILATDVFSADIVQRYGVETDLPNHQLLFSKNRLIVESLTNLDQLPPRGFIFSAAPVKYVGSSAPQVRAYAIIMDEKETCTCEPTPYRPAPSPAPRQERRPRYYRTRPDTHSTPYRG